MDRLNGNEFFGSTFACECGKTHRVQPREVVYSDDAADRLPSLCARLCAGRSAAILMDSRTRAAAGEEAAGAMEASGWRVTRVIVPDPAPGKSPVCDDRTKDALAAVLGDADLVLPVGGGVMTDLGKWLAQERKLPCAVLATAASMNGYSSANIAPTVGGIKMVLRAEPPAAVLASPKVLREAPYDLTASGLGDVLAKSVSSADWRLNHFLFGDYYCRRAVGLIADIEPFYLERPEDLRSRRPQAIAALFRALLLTGAAMTMAETSAPASGGEHMISHALDMMSSLDGAPHDLHGRQVGVGTVLAAELYWRVLAEESPRFVEPRAGVDRAFWGPLAEAVEKEYAAKADRLRLAQDRLRRGGQWDRLRGELAPMLRPPEAISRCLRRAGGACAAGDIGCDRERLLAAVLHAHEMRSRFTLLDLANLLGIMPGAGEEIVRTWA